MILLPNLNLNLNLNQSQNLNLNPNLNPNLSPNLNLNLNPNVKNSKMILKNIESAWKELKKTKKNNFHKLMPLSKDPRPLLNPP